MKLKSSLAVLLSLTLVLSAFCESDTENDFDDDDGVTVEDENIIVTTLILI